MKKNIFVFSLIVSVIFSGCNLLKSGPETLSLEGILSEQTVNDEYPGTHLITQKNGDVIPINSLSINLSDLQYLDNKVKITGIVNDETNVVEITGILVVEKLSKANAKGALVRYQNLDLGFKLKYYNDWEVIENNTGAGIEEKAPNVTFLAPIDESNTAKTDRSEIVISQYPFEYTPTSYEDGTTDTPLQAYFKDVDISKQLRKIGPDMMDAVEMDDDCGGESYYLYRDGFIYEIRFSCNLAVDTNRITNLKIFDEMVSEFQFITLNTADSGELNDDSTDIENDDDASEDTSLSEELPITDFELAEFQSTSFGFKALYPNQWYYQGSNTLEGGILYHYGFSDKPLDEGGTELMGLDLMSGDLPQGTSLKPYGLDGVKVSAGDNIEIYVKVGNRIYRIKGASEYADLMLNMATGIEKLEE